MLPLRVAVLPAEGAQALPLIMNTRIGKFIRSALFAALGAFFLMYALGMEPGGYRTAFFAFCGLDFIWAVWLLVSAIRNR